MQPWLDTGFLAFKAGENTVGDLPQQPDVMFWRQAGEGGEGFWQEAESLYPALIIVLCDGKNAPAPPAGLASLYRWQTLPGEDTSFLVASRLESEFWAPDWEAYRRGNVLTPHDQLKAVADAAYRLLLQELFRETLEWCGHTFSVVGPL